VTRRLRALAVGAAVLVAGSPAMGAPTAARDTGDRRADAAAKLDALEASDDELAAAADVLDAALGSAVRKASSARRAADEADLDLAEAEQELQATQHAVADRAVAAYTARGPQGLVPPGVVGSSPNDAVRRLALQRYVDGRLVDSVDRLRASRAELTERRTAAKAKAKAAASALAEVGKARQHATKARDDLAARIGEVQGEIAALDGEEAAVSRILASRPPTPARAASVGSGTSASGFAWPLTGGRTTSEFGQRWGRMHKGLDIAAPTGTPIHASRAGTVIHAGWQGGYGNLVLIDHGGGLVTAYGHQSRIATSVGTEVARGDLIGYVGSTGHSTGPHCHFEVRVNGTQQNPRRYLPPG
jgi:murein DD-endopeptidase MepM/ murein hydrolase activator NlpD